MYTAYIGRRLIALYNERESKTLSAREFFDEVFYPIFFESGKHLMFVHNSAFQQAYIQSRVKKIDLSKKMMEDSLATFHKNVLTKPADGSLFIGAPTAGTGDLTSGQITDLVLPFNHEDLYASWIGAALSIGINARWCIAIDEPDLIYGIYEGWKYYKKLLIDTPNLKGWEINEWNFHWMFHRFGKYYIHDNPLANRNPNIYKESVDKALTLKKPDWVRFLFMLSQHYPNHNLTGYIFRLCKPPVNNNNSTIGFIDLKLPDIKRLHQIYDTITGDTHVNSRKLIEDVYQTQYGFTEACKQGQIGLKALEPKDLRDIMTGRKAFKPPKDEATTITFNIYQTWIIAMLNNKQILEKTQQLAHHLRTFELNKTDTKMVRKRLVEGLLNATSKKAFIAGLDDIIKIDSFQDAFFDELVTEIMVTLPTDHFPLFITLAKFKYTVESNKPTQQTLFN